MENILHFVLLSFIGLSSLFVLASKNPIHSVLFLILTFLGGAAILLYWGAEFIALIFIIVYVGAIAVLFLFIVMMLNIKKLGVSGSLINYLPVGAVLLSLILIETKLSLSEIILPSGKFVYIKNWYSIIDGFSNTELLGQVLYNEFILCFMLCGILLLIAMLGAIVLTQNFSAKKTNELIAKQLSRISTIQIKTGK